MEHALDTSAAAPPAVATKLQPISITERIQAIDVVRGFALIGIFFMNVEWFNRSFLDFGSGIPASAKGWDWAATYFVNFFVAGKFWTIFSLLFGMGFAVMLTRSEDTGRAFIKPYIRRIAALGVFGLLHTILLWPGDILYSYAFTAAGLLIILFGNWKWILGSFFALVGIGFIPGMNSFWIVVGGILFMGYVALYMRAERRYSVLGMKMSLASIIAAVFALLLAIAATASLFVPAMNDMKSNFIGFTVVFLVMSFCATKFSEPKSARPLRAGILIYCLPFLVGVGFSLVSYMKPVEYVFASPDAVKLAAEKMAIKQAEEANEKRLKAEGKPIPKKEEKKEDKKIVKTDAQKKIERNADTIVSIKENQEKMAKDVAILTTGSYIDVVKHRWTEFLDGPFFAAGQAFSSVALFLMGVWFVRTGIITKAKDNLPLFRQIAVFGLPLGLGLSIFASSIAVSHVPGTSGDGWGLVQTLLNLGNLPTCLAYVSIIVLMVHSNSVFANIKVLAPFGRMALTNYLMQSLIQASFFYGWGMGHFGMGRASQLVLR
jgi:uncharacterized membrane protein YeiB